MSKANRILIVDDEPDVVEILSRQLGKEHYKILAVYSGKESLELLKKIKPDLILMDIMMPEMDGFETIRIIRDTIRSFIPIIIITATRDDIESVSQGFAVGADDYIVMPCNKEELLARVKAMLRIKELHGKLENNSRRLMKAYKELKNTRATLTRSEKLAVMGRLVANVAHELNNPLAIIIGGTQLALGRLDETEKNLRNQMERILRNAKRCKTIISNFLGYSTSIGKSEERVNIFDLFAEAVSDVRYQCDMNAVNVTYNRAKAVNVEVFGNRIALLSVFVNLIRNAWQAMNAKGCLTVNFQNERAKWLTIEIHDTGIGITEERKENLFQPFASGWKAGDGSGLGLATSLGIVEAHGGHMSVVSEGEGKGATFTIVLPCRLKEKEK